MSWSSDLYARLKAVAAVTSIVGAGNAARIYPQDAQQGDAYPRIVFSKLDEQPDYTHSGRGTSDVHLVELRCIATSYEGAEALAAAVDGALGPTVTSASVQLWLKQGEADFFEERGDGARSNGLHHRVLTFTAMGV